MSTRCGCHSTTERQRKMTALKTLLFDQLPEQEQMRLAVALELR
jgi:hypothetical protein